jgi:hypothetical protein
VTVPRVASTLAALASIVAAPEPARAQVGLPVGGDAPSLHIEVIKPFFDDPGLFAGSRIATSIWDASVVVPFEGAPTLFARLGFSFGTIEGASASATVSKPRLGAMITPRGGLDVEAHVDLPFTIEMGSSDYATGMGIFANYEELERFQSDSWSFGTSATAQTELDPGAFIGIRLGGTLLVPTGGGADTDLYAVYSAFGHVPAGSSRLRIEVSGIALVTEAGPTFSERSFLFASVMLSRPDVRFAPDLYVRVPVDESLGGILNFAVGLRAHMGG